MSALDSLAGLSVGDAFGARFFAVENRPLILDETAVPPAPWPWTDDTEMACNLIDVLHRHGQVDRDTLAAVFAERHDPYRSSRLTPASTASPPPGWPPASRCPTG